jgi:hypothetical protein
MRVPENIINISFGRLNFKALRPIQKIGFRGIIIILFALLNLQTLFSQYSDSNLFFPNGRPEVYFKFLKPSELSITEITRMISISTRRGDTIFAYANPQQFSRLKKLNLNLQLLTDPSLLKKAVMSDNAKGVQTWDAYPTYPAYVQMMQNYASAYPALCRLDTIGTSVKGHLLLFLEISDHPGQMEAKPEFMYSSTMHGDEVTGYVLMLHLIDYLLTNYGTDSLVTKLVKSLHIWINPLSNPDGTYYGGDNTVYGAIREFSDGVDPNRNFPDPQYGPHPDGEVWQKENIAMMNFMQKHRFVMSANLHGGDEVMNYPWDTWYKRHPDDKWLKFVSTEFADSAQYYGPAGYFTTVTSEGITDGYAWYTISGGRQDYMTYFMHGREITIELSAPKTPAASSLPTYWNATYRSFLHYMEESSFGLHGLITDSLSGNPVKAKIEVLHHDADHSEVYSDSITGFYSRLIAIGQYDIFISAPGYYSKLYRGVSLTNRQSTILNIKLLSASSNKLAPVLKDNSGIIVNSQVIDLFRDSTQSICLNISDPEFQQAWIDTILAFNSIVSVTFSNYDSCMVMAPATSFVGSDTLKVVLCDNGSPSLCDTVKIIAMVSNANLVQKIIGVSPLMVYPNPFKDQVTIKINNADALEKNVIVYDITGRQCLNETFDGPEKVLSTVRFGKGLYLLRVYLGSQIISTQKLIKIE